MKCTKCGAENADNAYKCVQCGEVLQHPAPPGAAAQTVPNYLIHAILVTLLCCLPLGIPAILFATQVNGKLQAGDIPGATEASKKAKLWCLIALGAGVVASVIGGVIMLIMVIAGAHR